MAWRPVTIASIIEGYGERPALPRLLHRVAAEFTDGILITPEPWRFNRGSLVAPGGIEKAVSSVATRVATPGGVLVLLDADDDCPAKSAPALLARARSARSDVSVCVVLAMREFENWFLAAASSLAGVRGLRPDLEPPGQPEAIRGAKEWLSKRRTDGHPYKPTVDQAALASAFDLKQARDNSQSFDKFCREVESLIRSGTGT